MILPPPYGVASRVAAVAPGFWPEFLQAANAAMWTGYGQPTSWYRSQASNAAVGGSPQSQHLLGAALDATGPNLDKLEFALAARGFRTVRYSGHVHAQAWPAGAAEGAGLFG